MIRNTRTNDRWWKVAGPHQWNDPDMLEIGVHGGMTLTEQITHFSLWCLMKSPLILGMNVLNMSVDTFSIISNAELIAINQDLLGVQAHHVANDSDDGTKEIWAGPLSNNELVVMLFNSGTHTTNITVTWAQLGISGTMNVRDLWTHNEVGAYTGSFTGDSIPEHGQQTYRFRPQTKKRSHGIHPGNKILFP